MTQIQLGQPTHYQDHYNADLLFPIARQEKRAELGIDTDNLPFFGRDIWNAYELSWLDKQGKPQVALGELFVPCTSACIVESKSLKLYFNSFNQSSFSSWEQVQKTIVQDVSQAVQAPVKFVLHEVESAQSWSEYPGVCLDKLPVTIDCYQPNEDFLRADLTNVISEQLYTHLLKSNCLVTSQPDWATLFISYSGPQIDHLGLLQYIVSLRQHNEFHEQCVERIFTKIMRKCAPIVLTVYARYTRRGGIDINPVRSTDPDVQVPNKRTFRQ